MFNRPARIERLDIASGRRILAISDIHANIPYFKGVLEKARFSSKDELIIDGDFLEKGQDSLKTLHIVMELCKMGNVHAVCGNCDDWSGVFDVAHDDGADEHLLHYMLWKKSGLLWDMCNFSGIDPFEIESFTAVKHTLYKNFREEFEFLRTIPHAIETEKFIFAHAGMTPGKALDLQSADELDRCDGLLTKDWKFDKWLIVGHWPVVLYGENTVCANPIIDREKKIISIDGGCVLKDDGQLNCLIIPDKNSEDFDFTAYDPFPVKTVLNGQQGSKSSYYIRWGDSTVQVLERGEEFSLCRHVRTGYTMNILTKYLFTDNEFTDCNDCTDYILPLEEGDQVSVVETCSDRYFVKHNGVSGWYLGELI